MKPRTSRNTKRYQQEYAEINKAKFERDVEVANSTLSKTDELVKYLTQHPEKIDRFENDINVDKTLIKPKPVVRKPVQKKQGTVVQQNKPAARSSESKLNVSTKTGSSNGSTQVKPKGGSNGETKPKGDPKPKSGSQSLPVKPKGGSTKTGSTSGKSSGSSSSPSNKVLPKRTQQHHANLPVRDKNGKIVNYVLVQPNSNEFAVSNYKTEQLPDLLSYIKGWQNQNRGKIKPKSTTTTVNKSTQTTKATPRPQSIKPVKNTLSPQPTHLSGKGDNGAYLKERLSEGFSNLKKDVKSVINRFTGDSKPVKPVQKDSNEDKSYIKTTTQEDLRKNQLLNTLREATGEEAIKAHKKLYNVVDPWIFVDKKNHRMRIYADGNNDTPLYDVPITVGKQHGDYGMQGVITAGELYPYMYAHPDSWSTPAGIFTISQWKPGSAYGIRPNGQRAHKGDTDGEPIINLKYESGKPTNTSFHAPISKYRVNLFRRMLTGENNIGNASMGCISPEDNVMRQLYDLNLLMDGDSVYINPEMEGNMIYHDMDNGKLKTRILWDDLYKSYGPRRYANRSEGTPTRMPKYDMGTPPSSLKVSTEDANAIDSTLGMQYIRAIENGDSIGFNSKTNTWRPPTGKQYDSNLIGIGLDMRPGGAAYNYLKEKIDLMIHI